MTDSKPKRKPAGAAVPGAIERPTLYPRVLNSMVSDDLADAIALTAKVNGVKKAEVVRDWLEAGRKSSAAQYVDES